LVWRFAHERGTQVGYTNSLFYIYVLIYGNPLKIIWKDVCISLLKQSIATLISNSATKNNKILQSLRIIVEENNQKKQQSMENQDEIFKT